MNDNLNFVRDANIPVRLIGPTEQTNENKITEIFRILFVLLIIVSHVFWIAVWMAYATIVRSRCDAGVPLAKVEVNARTVGRFKISLAFVILMNWAIFAF